MIAIFYLIVVILLGDAIGRRFFSLGSFAHRFASAFLVGLLVSSWWTYLCSLAFFATDSPMLWGNLVSIVTMIAAIYFLNLLPSASGSYSPDEALGFRRWDWIVLGLMTLLTTFLMFATFWMGEGKLWVGIHQLSDYGSTLSIIQSFALGHNFPTEFPLFAGDRMRYHFLYYFSVGNLEYLGLNPALGSNIISILSIVSMLILVMMLGTVVFGSRIVGRIAAPLFFFHGTLSFYPFITSIGSLSGVISKMLESKAFLPSGYPYRGETWGVWSQVVYANQRHLASSIGIFLLVLVFLLVKYKAAENAAAVTSATQDAVVGTPDPAHETPSTQPVTPRKTPQDWLREGLTEVAPFVFCGVLLGLMPMWNGAVFTAAATVLVFLFFLYPLRRQMVVFGVTMAIVSLPQIYFLKTGGIADPGYSLFAWGFTLEKPTVMQAVEYFGFTFGFKLLLLAVAVAVGTWFQRKLIIGSIPLIILTFFFQFSPEALTNHKFLNIWVIIANLFVASGLWFLWNLEIVKEKVLSRIVAVMLTVTITLSGFIDLFPFYTTGKGDVPYLGDPLVQWTLENTDPKAVFLTPLYTIHPVLLAGRRIFYGHPYYAWSSGYDTLTRDRDYRIMYESTSPTEVFQLLKKHNISFVTFDADRRRPGDPIKKPNEVIYKAFFDVVFDDQEGRYNKITIYKVPDELGEPKQGVELPPEQPLALLDPAAGVIAFRGGGGTNAGQFSNPRGIVADNKDNFYVADTGNSRIQKFDAEGKFISSFGTAEKTEGRIQSPNGIAIAQDGSIFVTDADNHNLVKFTSDGRFVKEFKGPDTGFYGPRDIEFGPNNQLYIVDQGRTRLVRFDPSSEQFTGAWGTAGNGEGQFNEATGLTIADEEIFVADAGNGRIQVFDLNGRFVRQWEIPNWGRDRDYPDMAFDPRSRRFYVTNGKANQVLALNFDGTLAETLTPPDGETLDNPSALIVFESKGRRRLLVLNTGGARVTAFELGSAADPTPKKAR